MTDEHLSARSRLKFGAVGTAVLAAGVLLAVTQTTSDHDGATYYTASFGRAGQGLDPRSEVKVRGIAVGGVESVRLDGSGRVSVRIRIDKGVRVTRTATARIEPVSVFGPKDLTLELGAGEGSGPYLPDGGTIARTEDPQELADTAWPAYRLASAINPDDVASILHTFAEGLHGQGPALRRTIGNTAKLVDLTYGNRAEIRQLITDVSALSGTLGGRGDTIGQTARDFNALSPALSGRPDKVEQLLTGATETADRVGELLRRRGTDLGEVIDGGADVVDVFYTERGEIPVLIEGLNGFFNLLATIIRVPGPENTLLAQAVAFLPLDVCKIIVDVCQASPQDAGSFLNIRIKGAR